MSGATRTDPDGTSTSRPSVGRGLGLAGTSFAVNGVVGLLGAIVTSRLYGVRVIGEYALVAAPWIMLIQLSSLAERMAFIRRASVLPKRDARVTALFLPVLAFSTALTAVVGAVVLAVAAIILRGPAGQPELVAPAALVVAGYLLLENPSANLDGVLSAFQAAPQLLAARLAQIGGFPLLAVPLYFWTDSVWGLTIATLGSFVGALAVRLYLVRPFLRLRISRQQLMDGARELPDLLRFGVRILPGRLATGFSSQAGTWVLGAIAPVAVVGAWSRAFQLAVRMNEAGYRLNEILYPALSQRFAEGDLEGYRRILGRTVRLVSVALLLVAATAAGAAEGVLAVFGDGFSRAAGAFGVLLVALAVGVVSSLLGQAAVAAGHPWSYSVISLVRASVALGLLVPGAALFGATGAAGALAAGITVDVVLRAWFIETRICRGAMPSGWAMVAVAVSTAVGIAAGRSVDVAVGGPIGVMAALGAGAVAYAAAALAFGAVSRDDRDAVREVLRQRSAGALANRGVVEPAE